MSEQILMDFQCPHGKRLEGKIHKENGAIVFSAETCKCEQKPTPSPTVEISLEDAKEISESLGVPSAHMISNIGMYRLMNMLKEAISKAESQNHPDPFPVNFDRDMKGNYPELNKTAIAVNTPALPIQDQVNELRKSHWSEIEKLKYTISELRNELNSVQGLVGINKPLGRVTSLKD